MNTTSTSTAVSLVQANESLHESERAILSSLKSRHSKDELYTRLGDRVLISMLLHPGNQNPLTRTSIAPKVSEDVSKEYATYLKQPALGAPGNPGSKSSSGQGLAAHVFDLTGAAYFHMVRQNQSQTIVLR